MQIVRWIAAVVYTMLVSCPIAAVCLQPLPRLVCAEYFRSKGVVIANLAGLTRVKDSYGDVTGTYYSMTVERTLHGEVPRLFRIYEANDSGRADFIWDIGESYLLFLREQMPTEAWVIDGCGNSGPVELRSKAVKAIEAITATSNHSTIQGAVGGRSYSFPLAGVQMEAHGPDGVKTAVTGRDGTFDLEVVPGKYEVRALSSGKSFVADELSYDDPGNLVLQAGGCAQVQFVESGQKR